MKLIVGLGNPGEKYLFTRHNLGFMAVDFFVEANLGSFKNESKFKSMVARFSVGTDDVLVIKPQTFMNLSGEALIAVMNFYKIKREDLLVIYDDISLDLGAFRFRASGSDGGHNGIKSIIKVLGSKDFDRLKIGIGPQPNIPSENYVLQNFKKEELEIIKERLKLPVIDSYLKEGLQKSQNLYN